MSMRVERSSLDQVKKRFEVNKKKLEEKQKEYDFEERMKELREEVSFGIMLILLGVWRFWKEISGAQNHFSYVDMFCL